MKEEKYSFGIMNTVVGILLTVIAIGVIGLFIFILGEGTFAIQFLLMGVVLLISGLSFLGHRGSNGINYSKRAVKIGRMDIPFDCIGGLSIQKSYEVIRTRGSESKTLHWALYAHIAVAGDNNEVDLHPLLTDKSRKFARIYNRAIRLVKATGQELFIENSKFHTILDETNADTSWSDKLSCIQPKVVTKGMEESEIEQFLDQKHAKFQEKLVNVEENSLKENFPENRHPTYLFMDHTNAGEKHIHYYTPGRLILMIIGTLTTFFLCSIPFFIGLAIESEIGSIISLAIAVGLFIGCAIAIGIWWSKLGWQKLVINDYSNNPEHVRSDQVSFVHYMHDELGTNSIIICKKDGTDITLSLTKQTIWNMFTLLNRELA